MNKKDEHNITQLPCWYWFSIPEISSADGGNSDTLKFTFQCNIAKKEFSFYYNPMEGIGWNAIPKIMCSVLPICARCTQCLQEHDSADNM